MQAATATATTAFLTPTDSTILIVLLPLLILQLLIIRIYLPQFNRHFKL